jgi:large subunit ribosomal protein L4
MALSLPIYNLKGESVGTQELNPTVFGVTPNTNLIHQAIVTFLANRRTANAHTKDRSEVAGTNKKPWRQKGTGRARAGSFQSPLWRGGGVTFGPRNERNYSLRFPVKMRQAAWKSALSAKVADGNVIILDSLEGVTGKTREWMPIVAALKLDSPSVLVVSESKSELADRAIRNIANQKYTDMVGVTIYDIVRHAKVVLTRDAVEALTNRLSSKEVVAKATKVKAA